jgi:hypothetical protein
MLNGEQWASPKREQWTNTARAALENAFGSANSIVQRYDTADTFAFHQDTSDEEMRQMANSALESKVAILRSAIDQLSWEVGENRKLPNETAEPAATKSQGSVPGLTPLNILREGIKAVPAVKYALGIAGIVAAIAIIKGFNLDFRIAVFGIVIMFALMTVLVIFAKLTTTAGSLFRVPVLIFMWFSLLMTIATATFLVTSVFLRWPVNLQYWLVNENNTDEHVTTEATAEDFKLIGGTGWILIGNYNFNKNQWSWGPFFEFERSVHTNPNEIPKIGETIRLKVTRHVIILDWSTRKRERRLEPPGINKGMITESEDYTPLTLGPGAVIDVADISAGHFPSRQDVVWARVIPTPK